MGALTRFDGYDGAKRVLGLAMRELRKRRDLRAELGMDPSGQGRPAITGREGHSVWNFLPLAAARGRPFTSYPHLTVTLSADHVYAYVTIPNGLRAGLRAHLRALSFEEFADLLATIEKRLRPLVSSNPGSAPWFLAVQRHYRGRRSVPTVDAELSFDLRTASGGRASVKGQPAWIRAAHEAMRSRRGNYQMTVGLMLPHGRCEILRDARILDTVAGAWIACRPLLDRMLARP